MNDVIIIGDATIGYAAAKALAIQQIESSLLAVGKIQPGEDNTSTVENYYNMLINSATPLPPPKKWMEFKATAIEEEPYLGRSNTSKIPWNPRKSKRKL